MIRILLERIAECIVDHLVELVEKKAAEIEAAQRGEKEAALAAVQ
jgi:hypothetical protein